MGCHASQPVGDETTQPQQKPPSSAHGQAPQAQADSPVAGAHEAATVLEPASNSPKSAVYTAQHPSPPEDGASDGSHARRLVIKASPSQHESHNEGAAPKPSHEGFTPRKRSNSVSLVTRERGGGSVSRVTRVADDELTPIAPVEAVVAAEPVHHHDHHHHVKSSPHTRSLSVSVANLDAHGRPESPLPNVPMRSQSPANSNHLGLSPNLSSRGPKKSSEVPLAQKIMQKQAVAAAREALHANETGAAPGSPVSRPNSNHSLRRPSVSKHEGSTSRLHVRAHSVNLDPNLLNLPNNPITAHNVQNLFERVATPPSLKREFSFGLSGGSGSGSGAGDSSPRGPPPAFDRTASVMRDKWAARTEELWVHYAGRHAHHMPKKALMQLSEDLFAEFIDKYKAKLRADFAKRHPNKEYTDAHCDKDLRTDLPFLLPAKASSSDKPEPDDYVHYIYRFTTREMRRFAAAAPGGTVSARDNGVGSIKSSPRSVSNRGAGGNMFNLDAPIGPAHSSPEHHHGGGGGGGGLGSERPAAHKLTKTEFTLGWGHCHDLLFKAIDADKERPGTPCRLM